MKLWALWHARCICEGIGPRTRRLVTGKRCKARWRDHNPQPEMTVGSG